LATSERSSAVRFLAVAFPPFRPSATAAGFLRFAIVWMMLTRCSAVSKIFIDSGAEWPHTDAEVNGNMIGWNRSRSLSNEKGLVPDAYNKD
jgi:hypothetical protein